METVFLILFPATANPKFLCSDVFPDPCEWPNCGSVLLPLNPSVSRAIFLFQRNCFWVLLVLSCLFRGFFHLSNYPNYQRRFLHLKRHILLLIYFSGVTLAWKGCSVANGLVFEAVLEVGRGHVRAAMTSARPLMPQQSSVSASHAWQRLIFKTLIFLTHKVPRQKQTFFVFCLHLNTWLFSFYSFFFTYLYPS